MGKLINLTGKRFGKLLVIYRVGSKYGAATWWCKCDCGNEKEIKGRNLLKGDTKSCGCLYQEFYRKRVIDLTGKKFGSWIVLCRVQNMGIGS